MEPSSPCSASILCGGRRCASAAGALAVRACASLSRRAGRGLAPASGRSGCAVGMVVGVMRPASGGPVATLILALGGALLASFHRRGFARLLAFRGAAGLGDDFECRGDFGMQANVDVVLASFLDGLFELNHVLL